MAALFIVDHVLMRMMVGREARQGGEEVLKWADIDGRIKYWERESNG